MDFLTQIVKDIREQRQTRKKQFSKTDFIKQLPTLTPTHPEKILKKISDDFFLITECKQASPSKGLLCPDYDPVRIARSYAAGGASAISVLTEEKYFQGSPIHLQAVRKAVSLPLLWKDFVIHEEQIAQARTLGADLVLLIFRILNNDIHRMITFTLQCGLVPLVEVFIGDDPHKIASALENYPGQCLIGVNNRDLTTFHTDITNSASMYKSLPSLQRIFPFISESGINTREDIQHIKKIGFRGALVGESLIKQKDPGSAVKHLLP